MIKNSRDKSGFTLIEVVVSTMVVGLGIGGLMGLVFWMVRANDWSGDLSGASTLGQDKLEDLLDTSYLSISGGSDTVGEFRRAWQVSASPSNTFKTIDVQIEWDRLDEAISHVTLSSLLSNPAVPGIDLSPLKIDEVGGGGGGSASSSTGGA